MDLSSTCNYGAHNCLWMDPANAASSVDFFLPVDATQLNIITLLNNAHNWPLACYVQTSLIYLKQEEFGLLPTQQKKKGLDVNINLQKRIDLQSL